MVSQECAFPGLIQVFVCNLADENGSQCRSNVTRVFADVKHFEVAFGWGLKCAMRVMVLRKIDEQYLAMSNSFLDSRFKVARHRPTLNVGHTVT